MGGVEHLAAQETPGITFIFAHRWEVCNLGQVGVEITLTDLAPQSEGSRSCIRRQSFTERSIMCPA